MTAAVWEAIMSNLLRLGGTAGGLQTSDAGCVTINQAADDTAILQVKSSDVAHGMTTIAETDTYGCMVKTAAANGGLTVRGLSETVAAFKIEAYGTGETTTKSTAGTGTIVIDAAKANGTGLASLGADGNLLVIRDNTTTRFIFDVEGSFHADVGSTTFDAYDDVALLDHLDAAITRDPVKTEFGRYLDDYRAELQSAKIAHFDDSESGRTMVDLTRLAMLLTGAVRQLGRQKADLEERLARIESRLALLPESLS